MPKIELSDELFARAQTYAIPLVDTLEDVFNRALDALELRNGHRLVPGRLPSPSGASATGSDLVSHVGRIPHGTHLRMRYKGSEYLAEVNNGKVIWNGRRFKSLSHAAVAGIQSTEVGSR
jgi:hypothetical protein